MFAIMTTIVGPGFVDLPAAAGGFPSFPARASLVLTGRDSEAVGVHVEALFAS